MNGKRLVMAQRKPSVEKGRGEERRVPPSQRVALIVNEKVHTRNKPDLY